MMIRDLMKKLLLVTAFCASAGTVCAQGKPAWRFEKGSDEHRLMMTLSKLARSAKSEVLPPLDGALSAAHKARTALEKFAKSNGSDADRTELVNVGKELKGTLNDMLPLLQMASKFVRSSVERAQRLSDLRKQHVKSDYLEEILKAAEAANSQALHQFREDKERLVELLYVICSLQEALINNAMQGLKKVAKEEFGEDKYNRLFAMNDQVK